MNTPSVIHVHTFGELSLEYNGRILDFSFDHPYKLWLLILYFVRHRDEDIRARDLVDFIWRDSDKSKNPLNALKALLFRLRNKLDELAPGVGRDWITFSGGCYHWTAGSETLCDYDEFDRYMRDVTSAESESEKTELLMNASRLYEGEFAQRLSYDPWVADIAAKYRDQYLNMVEMLPPLLEKNGQYDEIIRFCMNSLEFDPYNETLGVYLMRALGKTNRHVEAISLYETISSRLLNDIGVIPSDMLRNAYRDALSQVPNANISFPAFFADLSEQQEAPGPIFCDYDYFRTFYRLESRHIARSGGACQVALFSLESKSGAELSPRSLSVAFRNLREVFRSDLRAGDVVSVCSNGQYAVILPDANHNSSIAVCMRISQKFSRQYPHSPAAIHFDVREIEPFHSSSATSAPNPD